MLHIQEPFVHNSNLLMNSPKSVIIQPQSSSSTRSNKVIEQLSDKYESTQRDIIATRAQLEIIRQSKLKHEKETMHYTKSSKIYRARIKEIMQVLKSKQEVLESTKCSSNHLELRLKQLKDEAMASRKQSEDLRRREQVLEHDRDEAVKENNQIKHRQHHLQDSVDQLRVRCEREMALLAKDHFMLTDQVQHITERNEHIYELITLKLKQRRQYLDSLTTMKRQSRSNMESFVNHVRLTMQPLQAEIEQSELQTKDCILASIQCRGEVNGLVSRIKTIAAEISTSGDQQQQLNI